MPAVRYGGAAAGVNAEGIYACGRDNSDAASFTANAYGLDSWRTLTAPSAAKTDVPNLGVGL